MARKQVHLLMPEALHELVKARADEAGVSLTAYVLSVLETDLNAESHSRTTLNSLALRVRSIEVHLGLDSRQPGFLRVTGGDGPAADEAPAPPADDDDHTPRRRASDQSR
ncbi:MAG: hypothetical protein ACKO5F_04010 [Synechococcus sp.]